MYRSMIRIEQGNDTIFDTNKKISLELASGDAMFRVSVNHEDMTLEKIKEIKRSKAAAGSPASLQFAGLRLAAAWTHDKPAAVFCQ